MFAAVPIFISPCFGYANKHFPYLLVTLPIDISHNHWVWLHPRSRSVSPRIGRGATNQPFGEVKKSCKQFTQYRLSRLDAQFKPATRSAETRYYLLLAVQCQSLCRSALAARCGIGNATRDARRRAMIELFILTAGAVAIMAPAVAFCWYFESFCGGAE